MILTFFCKIGPSLLVLTLVKHDLTLVIETMVNYGIQGGTV